MRIAIMQPYFIPYAGYFRLFHSTDLFVIYDCVQFLRRGWMHRNRLYNSNGELSWLTLPLQKASQEVLIKDLIFAENCNERWMERLRSFPQLHASHVSDNHLILQIKNITQSPVEFIISTLRKTCEILKMPFNTVRSSMLNLPAELKGEDRIIEIVRHFGAKDYINLAGGRELYDTGNFRHHGIKLQFLTEYQGSYDSILQRFVTDGAELLNKEIIEQSKFD